MPWMYWLYTRVNTLQEPKDDNKAYSPIEASKKKYN